LSAPRYVFVRRAKDNMDCYFHSHVPSVAPCGDCGKPICATCRDSAGLCPSCRLAAKMQTAQSSRQHLGGQVPPRPHAEYQGQQYQQQYQAPPSAPTIRQTAVAATDPVESRALVALGYPLFPFAALALLDKKASPALRRGAWQALGFNAAFTALWFILSATEQLPFMVGISSGITLALLVPAYFVASVYYGIKTWQGDYVRVPILSDWIEERIPAKS
jgi:hypothetical protein